MEIVSLLRRTIFGIFGCIWLLGYLTFLFFGSASVMMIAIGIALFLTIGIAFGLLLLLVLVSIGFLFSLTI